MNPQATFNEPGGASKENESAGGRALEPGGDVGAQSPLLHIVSNKQPVTN